MHAPVVFPWLSFLSGDYLEILSAHKTRTYIIFVLVKYITPSLLKYVPFTNTLNN
jgi:hypothetical protein